MVHSKFVRRKLSAILIHCSYAGWSSDYQKFRRRKFRREKFHRKKFCRQKFRSQKFRRNTAR